MRNFFCMELLPSHIVVGIATVGPGEGVLHASKGVEQSPSDDHIVVDGDQEGDTQHPIAETLEGRGDPAKELVGSNPTVLTNGQLKVEQGEASQCQHEGVGKEEGSSTMLVAQIGKSVERKNNKILCNFKVFCAKMCLPPHVSQSDCVPQAREEEVALVVPVSSAVGSRRRIVVFALLGLLAGTHLDRCQRSFRASNKFSSFSSLSARKKTYSIKIITGLFLYIFSYIFVSLLLNYYFHKHISLNGTFSSSLRPTL